MVAVRILMRTDLVIRAAMESAIGWRQSVVGNPDFNRPARTSLVTGIVDVDVFRPAQARAFTVDRKAHLFGRTRQLFGMVV